MSTALDMAHTALMTLTRGLLWPAGLLPDTHQWLWAAILSGFGLALLWRWLQSPQGLQAALSAVRVEMLAVWLFRQEPSSSARVQARALASNCRLLWHMLWPLVATVALTAPLLLQIHTRYGYQPWEPGAALIVRIDCADPGALQDLQVVWSGATGQVETIIREPQRAAAILRLRSSLAGNHELRLSVGGQRLSIPLSVAESPTVIRLGTNPGERLLFGGLPADGPVRRVRLGYEPVSWRWWLLFSGATCVGAAMVWGLSRVRVMFGQPRA